MNKKKLVRHEKNTVIAGVCGSFAEYFEINPKVVRFITIVLTILTAIFPGVLLYLTLMLIIPREIKESDDCENRQDGTKVIHENITENMHT
ncbi:MAG: PspC domain-containing protein [Paludibacteraceae bacterium]